MSQKFQVHKLSFKKSPIKNQATLFCVIIIGSNTTRPHKASILFLSILYIQYWGKKNGVLLGILREDSPVQSPPSRKKRLFRFLREGKTLKNNNKKNGACKCWLSAPSQMKANRSIASYACKANVKGTKLFSVRWRVYGSNFNFMPPLCWLATNFSYTLELVY